MPFAAAAGVAVLVLALSFTLGNDSGARGAATARAAVVAYVAAYRTHDKAALSRLTCPDRSGTASLALVTGAAPRISLDADQRHATVASGAASSRLRIEHVAGRYFACPAG